MNVSARSDQTEIAKNIREVAEGMMALIEKQGYEFVRTGFHGITLDAKTGDTVEKIIKDYRLQRRKQLRKLKKLS